MATGIQPSFAAGEITPELFGRPDQNLYHIGLRKARNMQVSTTGGIYNRAGLRYVGNVKWSERAAYNAVIASGDRDSKFAPGAKLFPFKFSAEDNYVLEFGHKYVRFVRNDAHVLIEGGSGATVTRGARTYVNLTNHGLQSGDDVFTYYGGNDFNTSVQWGNRWFKVIRVSSSRFELRDQATGLAIDSSSFDNPGNSLTFDPVYEVETPYAYGDVGKIDYAQLNDILTLVHPDYEPHDLKRKDHDDWELVSTNRDIVISSVELSYFWIVSSSSIVNTPVSETLSPYGLQSYVFRRNDVSRNISLPDDGFKVSLPGKIWTGGFSVGDKVWLVNDNDNTLEAYSHSGGNLTRASGDVSLANKIWMGGFSVGDKVWLVNDSDNTLEAYSHSGGNLTRASGDVSLVANKVWTGGFSVGDKVWLVNDTDNTLEAYSHSGGNLTRASGDVSLANKTWTGGFSVGDKVWLVNDRDNTLEAYSHSGGNLTRASGDVSLANKAWTGGFSVGDKVWLVNDSDNTLEARRVSEGPLSGDVSLASKAWTGGFSVGDKVWLVNNTDNTLEAYSHSGGNLTRASGDVSLANKAWTGGFSVGDKVWLVNDTDTDKTLEAYSHSGGNLTRASGDVSLARKAWTGGFSVGDKVWLVNDTDNTLEAYSHSGGNLTRASGDVSLANKAWTGGFSVGDKVWLVNDSDNTLEAYSHSGGNLTRASGDVSLANKAWTGGFSVGGERSFKENTFPGTTGYHQQRKILGGSNSEPAKMYYSKTGVYDEFGDSGAVSAEDDPIEVTLASGDQNQLRYVVPLRDLLLLTDQVQWEVSSGGQGFSASTLQQRPQTRVGAAFIKPQVFDDYAVYVREGQKEIIGVGYSEQRGGFTPVELSLLSRHLFEDDPCRDIGAALTPEKRLACVTEKGKVGFLTFNPEQKVTAWTSWDTGPDPSDEEKPRPHAFEAVQGARASVELGAEDVHYFVVKRTVDDKTVRYIERTDDRKFSSLDDAFFVDSGLSVDAGLDRDFRTVGGLWHLEGEDVDVLADGVAYGRTVSNGRITLPPGVRARKWHVGLNYASEMQTLEFDRYPRENDITDQGKIRFIPYLLVNVRRTQGVQAAASREVDLDGGSLSWFELEVRKPDGKTKAVPFTHEGMSRAGLDEGWKPSQGLLLRQTRPLPMNILSVIPVFDTEDDR